MFENSSFIAFSAHSDQPNQNSRGILSLGINHRQIMGICYSHQFAIVVHRNQVSHLSIWSPCLVSHFPLDLKLTSNPFSVV